MSIKCDFWNSHGFPDYMWMQIRDAADLGEEVIEDVSSQKRQAEGQRLAFLYVGENWEHREVLSGEDHPETVVHTVTMG